jgi:hypothetical protein
MLAISAWLILSASRRSRIRAPKYASMAIAFLGEADFRLAFFIAALADDLEEAITVDVNVARSVRMKRRLSRRHQNPILAFYVSRKPGSRHSSQSQCAVIGPAINIVLDRAAHRKTIAIQRAAAIACAV